MFPVLMEKGLSKIIKNHWASLMKENLPHYVPYKEKTIYLWSDESAWWFRKDKIALFVIFKTYPKGGSEFTIELGWSRKMRFPELSQRPSLVSKEGLENPEQYEEATFRITELRERQDSLGGFIRIFSQDFERVLDEQMKILLEYGVPYLEKLQ
ncbi:hypothetical protein LJC22_05285 [Desulfosarcina sp. OttesenSCG-928-G10]|nr:hypothetical protein [Desulfosarcina sp. OttesenSCG-928-G10]MDL2322094.1 hypothetical protein [Desulfosarcina sp. OttesenSCG-928-B08]